MYRRIILLILLVLTLIFVSLNIKISNLNTNKYINVEVKGEVIENKSYKVSLGTNVGDLLNDVDLLEDADLSGISLNEVLHNNQIITIPKKNNYELISINSANISMLISLPGIGKSTAEKIINYRNTYGSFTNLEDLKNISGIGDTKYERLKPYICL